MDHTFPVIVVDDKGAPVTGARVVLVEQAVLDLDSHPFASVVATHSDAGGGHYKESAAITPTAGQWGLVVTLDKKAPVFQPLTFKGKGGEFTASPRPSAVATVTITSAQRMVGGVKVKEITFHVVLHPAAELVFIGGVDYSRADVSGGWLFHEYGFHRAESLRREKKIHPGTVVTVFSCAKIQRIKKVFGIGKWVEIENLQIHDPATRTLGVVPYVPKAGVDIHIQDFYRYLADLGTSAKQSVKEIGIFSHSWPGGPILYNTGERAAFPLLRDPLDFDARAKDFRNNTTFAPFAKMKDSFMADARFTIWGCSATTHYKFRSREAAKAIDNGLKEDDFFTVRSELVDNHDASVGLFFTEEEHTSELRHRFRMDELFRKSTYAAEAAKRLGIEVRAGCPGTGSDPTKVEGIDMLMVNLTTYADVYRYFHKKFAPEFAETKGKWDQGYVDYHALQSRAPVADPGFSTEYYDLGIRTKVTRWQTAANATLTFWNWKSVEHPTPNVSVVLKAKADLVTAGKKGHLLVLKDKDKTKSQGFFVQEDAKIFRMTRDAKEEWTVVGAEL